MTTPRFAHGLGLALLAVVGAALIAPFAQWPAYRHLPEGLAVVKLSFSHEGARAEPCRALNEAERAALPKHMRKVEECPRRRLPVLVEVLLDGETIFLGEEPPTGFAGDGASRFYERAEIAAGGHALTMRLRDSARTEGFDHESVTSVQLAPAQVLVIGFDAESGTFVVR